MTAMFTMQMTKNSIEKKTQQSSRENKDILVAYHFNTNLIKWVLIKSKHSQVITEVWEALREEFKQVGGAPKTCVLDYKK